MDEITYQELINKFNGLSQKVFALARTMDQFHKRNAVPGELPLPVLAIAKEFLSNASFTIDAISDKMDGEKEEMDEYLADCGHDCQ